MILPAVHDIKVWDVRGPWKTKSSGNLMVGMAIPSVDLKSRFFKYSQKELQMVSQDIRGLRIYTVRQLPKDAEGGGEFHRIREEIVIGLDGKILWECWDLEGRTSKIDITPEIGLWMPLFILHRYRVLEDNSGLMVVCNTLFNPEDPKTHDTYPEKDFMMPLPS